MAGNEIIYTIGFEANTQNVAKQLETVQTSLDKITQFKFNKAVLGDFNSELVKSVQSAANLKSMLKQATDVKTGKLNLTQFRESIERSGKSIKDYAKDMAALGPEGQQAFLQIANAVSASNAPLIQSTKLMNSFWNSLKRTAQFQISTSVYRTLVGGLSSAYRYAQNLNSSLNDIRIVTGQSAEQMERFAKKANAAAKELRTTTTDYTNASLIFYQQGLSDEAVKERTDTTIKMANVTKDSAEEVSSYMTAIWNNFDDGSRSLESYADTITALGAATASSSAEIAAGLEKFASVADQIGLSYNYATSALATVVAQTRQSEDVVGTAFKTIFARIQGLNLGKTQEDGTTLNQYSEALSKVGVNIKDTMGQVKNMDTILDETGAKWQALAKDQRIALAQAVAGTRQYTQFMALMDNWDIFKENLATAENAEGSLQQQANTYAESWDAARKKVQASMEGLYDSILDDKFFIKTTNAVAGLISMIQKFTDSIGGMKGVVAGLTVLFTTVFKDKIANSIAYATNSMRQLLSNVSGKNSNFKSETADAAVNTYKVGASLDPAEIYSRQVYNLSKVNEVEDKISKEDAERLKNNVLITAEIEKQALRYQEQQQVAQQDAKKARLGYNLLLSQGQDDKDNKLSTAKIKIKGRGDLYDTVKGLKTSEGKSLVQGSKGYFKLADLPELIKLNAAQEQMNKAVVKYNEALKQLDPQSAEYTQQLERLKEKLKEVFMQFESQGQAIKDLENPMEKATLSGKDFATILELVQDKSKTYSKNVDDIIAKLRELADAEEDVANSTSNRLDYEQTAEDRDNDLDEQIRGAIRDNDTIEDGYVNVTRAVASYSMAITTAVSSLKILGDETESFSSKLMALSSLIAFTGPQVISLVKGVSSLTKALAAGQGMMAALTAATGSAGTAAAIMALIPPLTVILAILGAIYATWKLLHIEQDKNKKITQALQEQTQKTQEAKQASDDLKSSIESYQDARKALDSLTEGTQEFTDALQEANSQAMDLLTNNSDLWQYAYTDEKGRISFTDKGLAQIQKDAQENFEKQQRQQLNLQQSKLKSDVAAKREQIRYKSGLGYTVGQKSDHDGGKENISHMGLIDDYAQGKITIDDFEEQASKVGVDYEKYSETIKQYVNMVQALDKQVETINPLIAKSELSSKIEGFSEKSQAVQGYIASQMSQSVNDKIKNTQKVYKTKSGIQDELVNTYGYTTEDLENLDKDTLSNMLANEEVYSGDDINKQVEDLQKAAEGLQEASKTLGLSENTLLQAASGDVSELADAVGTTLPSKIKDLEKGVKDALGEDNITPEIEDIFNNYDSAQVINNIISQSSAAFDTASAAIYDFLDNGVFSDEHIAALKEKFQGIFDFSNFDDLSTYEKIEAIGNAQEAAITKQQEAIEDYKKSYQSLFNEQISKSQAAFGKGDLDQVKKIKSSIESMQKTLNNLPTLEDKLKTDKAQKNLEKAVAHLKSWDNVVEKISKKGKIQANDLAAVLDAIPDLIRYVEIDAAKGIAKLNSEGMKKLKDFQAENKAVVTENAQQLQEKIKEEQGLYGALIDYINEAQLAEENRNSAKQSQMSETAKKAYQYFGAELAADLQKNFQEKQNSENTAMSQISDANEVSATAQEQGKNVAQAWIDAFKTAAQASAVAAQAMNHNQLHYAEENFAADTGNFDGVQPNITAGQASEYKGFENSEGYEDYQKKQKEEQQTFDSINLRLGDERFANVKWSDDQIAFLNSMGFAVEKGETTGQTIAKYGRDSIIKKAVAVAQTSGVGNNEIGGGGKGSKGGGKSDNSKTPDRIDKKELEHYTEVNKLLERQDDLLSELDTQISRTFGLKQIDEYEEKIKGINKQIDLLDRKTKEAKGWVKQDLADLKEYQDEMKFTGLTDLIKIDDKNNIVNKEEALKTITDAYNDIVKQFNAKVAKGEKESDDNPWKFKFFGKLVTPEEAEKAYSYFSDVLGKVEEDLDVVHQNELDRLEALRNKADAVLEQVMVRLNTYKDVKGLYDTANELGKKIAEAVGSSLDHELKSIKLDLGDITTYGNIKIANNPLNRNLQEVNEIRDTYNNLISKMDMGEISTATFKDKLQEISDEAGSTADTLLGYLELLENGVKNVVDDAKERFESFTSQLEHNSTILDSAKEIMELEGLTYKTSKGYSTIAKLSQEQVNSSIAQAKLNKQYYEEMRDAVDKVETELAKATEGTEQYDILKANRDALLEEMNSAQEAMLSSAKEAMDAAKEFYTTQIEKAAYEFGQAVSGDLGLDLLAQKYQDYTTIEEEYYDKVNESYQINQWNLKLEKLIDETKTSAHAKELKNLQDEIEIRKENNKLNQYDITILEKKLAMLQAQQALEDAENAKNSVRLVRDDQGNWNYQFTADQGAIDDAQSQYNQAMNDWYNTAKDQVKNISNEIVNMKKEASDAVKEIYDDLTLTSEEREAKLEEIRQYYNERAKYLYAEQKEAIADMNEAGNVSIDDFSNNYAEDLIDMTDNLENFKSNFKNYFNDCEDALDDYNDTVDDIADESGTNFKDLKTTIDDVSSSTEKVQKAGESAVSSMMRQINSMIDYTNQWSSMADEIIRACNALNDYQNMAADKANELSGNVLGTEDKGEEDYAREALAAARQGDATLAFKQLANRESKTGEKNSDSLVNLIKAVLSGDVTAEVIADSVVREKRKIRDSELSMFDTGGYTGDFQSAEGRLAVLHSKELVLNADDTKNILTAVEGIRTLSPTLLSTIEKAIDNNSLIRTDLINGISGKGTSGGEKVVQQTVAINATFPNVSNSSEIEEALNNLTNQAIQYSTND